MRTLTVSPLLLIAAFLLPAVAAGDAKPAPPDLLVEVTSGKLQLLASPSHRPGTPVPTSVIRVPGSARSDVRVARVPAGKWLQGIPEKNKVEYRLLLQHEWRVVRHARPVPIPQFAGEDADRYRVALDEWLRPAGREKGPPSPVRIWSPAGIGKTWKPGLKLAWVPQPGAPISFRLQRGDLTLWRRDGVDSKLGSLEDPDLERCLAGHNPAFPLRLQAMIGERSSVVNFVLGDGETEPDLPLRLEWWEQNTRGVSRLLGQAAELQRRQFYSAATLYYYRAWRQDRSSRLLENLLTRNLGRLGLSDAEVASLLTAGPARPQPQ